MVDSGPTVTFADTVTGISPPASSLPGAPASSCSQRPATPRRNVASGLLFTLVGVMFGACLLYLVSRLVALNRKVAVLEQGQKKNNVTVADAAQDISEMRRVLERTKVVEQAAPVEVAAPKLAVRMDACEGPASIPNELRAMLPFACGAGVNAMDNLNVMIFETFCDEFAQPADLARRVEEIVEEDEDEEEGDIDADKGPGADKGSSADKGPGADKGLSADKGKGPEANKGVSADKELNKGAESKMNPVDAQTEAMSEAELSAFVSDLVAPMAAAVKEFEKEAATPTSVPRVYGEDSSGEDELDVKLTPPVQPAATRTRRGRAKKV